MHLLAVLILGTGLAVPGWTLSSEGSRRLAEINARLRYCTDPGPDFATFKEPDAVDITFSPYLFADLPTGTEVYFCVPTIGFGRFLMVAPVALLGLDVRWLRRRHLTNKI